MNATLMINSFTREEQEQLLQALVDRLYPEAAGDGGFPKWLMEDLQQQHARYLAGTETGDDVDTVEARLVARLKHG